MTSFIGSKVDSVTALRFFPIPVKPITVARAVRSGKVTVFIDDKNRLYSTEVRDRMSYSLGRHKLHDTLACCVKLRLLSAAAVREHTAYNEKVAKISAAGYSAQELGRGARDLGIKLTATQAEKARKAIHAASSTHTVAMARIAEAGLAA